MDLDDEDIVDENERARRQERRAVLTEEQAQREEEQRLAHVVSVAVASVTHSKLTIAGTCCSLLCCVQISARVHAVGHQMPHSINRSLLSMPLNCIWHTPDHSIS